MTSLISLPFTKAFVRKRFIQQESDVDGLIECYLVAVCVVLNEAPKIMLMTHEGAMFCYVPPHAICFGNEAEQKRLSEVCMWDCLADAGEVVELEFLKHMNMQWNTRYHKKMSGRYLFSLHFDPRQNWNRFPEQLKIFHFVHGDDNNLHVVVNNQSKFMCDAIYNGELTVIPDSNTQIWFCE